MSLILDALRKSDAERQRRATDTLRAGPTPATSGSPPTWLWLLLGLTTLISTGAAVTLAWHDKVTAVSTGATPSIPERAPAPVRPLMDELSSADTSANAATISTASGEGASEPVDATTNGVTDKPNVGGDETLLTAPPLSSMPDDFRQSLPKLEINAHAWNENPALRFVLINFRRYAEGDTLREGPVLRQIQRDGVILDYHGETFFLSR